MDAGGSAARRVRQFICRSGQQHFHAGKTLIPFSTHEGSGLSGFDSKLAEAVPDADVLDGLAIRGNDAQNAQEGVRASVGEWISGLGLQ